jgi:hypothetical protein
MAFAQQISTKFRIIAGILAASFLVICLSAKIPSSHCHCNDPVKSKKEACPFATLRTLTFVQPTLEMPLIEFVEVAQAPAFFYELISVSSLVALSFDARAPPIS